MDKQLVGEAMRLFRLQLTLLIMLSAVVASAAPPTSRAPIAATVDSTLASQSGQIRQLAFDGDNGTYFASRHAPAADDHFTLVFDAPVSLKSIRVETGKPDGTDKVDHGTLEVSD